MIFTKYSTAKEFADDTLDILKKYEIQNNLVFKNIDNGLAKDNDSSLSYELVMATVKDDNGDVLLTGIRTVPFPFVIFATDNYCK